jgi:hypothetical protein
MPMSTRTPGASSCWWIACDLFVGSLSNTRLGSLARRRMELPGSRFGVVDDAKVRDDGAERQGVAPARARPPQTPQWGTE